MLKILVIGITGMLGNTLLRSLSKNKKFSVLGSSRRDKLKIHQKINYKHLKNLDVENEKEFFQGKSSKDFYCNPKDREDIVQEVISKGFSDLRELELIKPDGTTT